jgi:hypothetical protein
LFISRKWWDTEKIQFLPLKRRQVVGYKSSIFMKIQTRWAAEGVAQVVQHLPSHVRPEFKPSTTKKIKKKGKYELELSQ